MASRLEPAYSDVDETYDIAAAVEASESVAARIVVGKGDKESSLFGAFHAAAEEYRGKLLFVWSSESRTGISFHRKSRHVMHCLEDACTIADSLVAWLRNILSHDETTDEIRRLSERLAA